MKIWTGIVTDKIQESKDFYTRFFSCNVLYDSEWFILLELGGGELGFLLPSMPQQDPRFQTPSSGTGLFIVVDVEDVDAEFDRMREMGAPILFPVRQEEWGDRHFAISDPTGVPVDIVSRIEVAP